MSGFYIIERSHCGINAPVPPAIALYITPNEFSSVCHAVNQCYNESLLMSCAGEAGVCFFTGFFCIFFAHPCIQEMVVAQMLPK